MQVAEDEVEGIVLTYVTETEFRKQRSRSPSCNSLVEWMRPELTSAVPSLRIPSGTNAETYGPERL